MASLGIQLETLCSQAQSEVILAAPFIKAPTLNRLLSKFADDVSLRCITRWRPEEILAGVSDLEVWTLLSDRPHTSLWLRTDLHAKFYRADGQCLVGSANLTAKALGWSSQNNLELLVSLPATEPSLRTFEAELLANCIQVDQAIFDQVQATVQLLKEQQLDVYLPEYESSFPSEEISSGSSWLPSLRNPEDLYLVYSGRMEGLSTASREAALLDLRSLPLPAHLSRSSFESYIGSLLLQKPIIWQVDQFLKIPRRFGAVADFLSSFSWGQEPNFDPDRSWQTMMRWLRHFLPNRYTLSVPNHSEVFGRVNHDRK